ncbi:hypothetical protein [Tepidibacter formicigenes]|jgi:hypothetical protein|uniref:Uncharacterized protein n=1 Tax=Tepidibacter formicigenes DSM 15518 TaxID=1123349 RepID=A0A1M6PSN2_9FIRM|nr:hypothetical protein [Tepidibacter formicigenes]SHK10936.1 hypothetical protein SAMN02744037_01639 [Tepidibacter formicigenes DSM 15518]
MKQLFDFNALENIVLKLDLKQKSINTFFQKINDYKNNNPDEYKKIFNNINLKELKNELKLSIISLVKDYTIINEQKYRLDITLAYSKNLDIILEYKSCYTLSGDLISSSIIVDLNVELKL